MLREEKYNPRALITYCPVCGHRIDNDEWRDYGMHLHCTELHKTGKYYRQKQNWHPKELEDISNVSYKSNREFK